MVARIDTGSALFVAMIASLATRGVYAQMTPPAPPCYAESLTKAQEIVDKGYSWCDLDADLGLRLAWIDDGIGYMEAFYGSAKWSRLNDNSVLLLVIQRLLFMIVSIGGNCRVLFYHWTVPAHPKFSLALGSRLGRRPATRACLSMQCLPTSI